MPADLVGALGAAWFGEPGASSVPRKLGTFFIWTSSFSSSGMSKKALPSVMTSWIRELEMPAWEM